MTFWIVIRSDIHILVLMYLYVFRFHSILPSLLALVSQNGTLQFWDVNAMEGDALTEVLCKVVQGSFVYINFFLLFHQVQCVECLTVIYDKN